MILVTTIVLAIIAAKTILQMPPRPRRPHPTINEEMVLEMTVLFGFVLLATISLNTASISERIGWLFFLQPFFLTYFIFVKTKNGVMWSGALFGFNVAIATYYIGYKAFMSALIFLIGVFFGVKKNLRK